MLGAYFRLLRTGYPSSSPAWGGVLSSGEFPTNPSSSLAWAGILSSGGFPTIPSSSLAWAGTLSSDGSATKSEIIKKTRRK